MEVMEEAGHAGVEGAIAFAAGFMGESAGEEGFAAACGADNEHILVLTDPGHRGKPGEERSVKSPGMAVVDILDRGVLSEFGLAEPVFQAAVLPVSKFTINEKPEALLEAQGIDLRHVHLLLKGAGHAGQLQAGESFYRRMGQHGRLPSLQL
jgi:hypothetical protein